MVTKPRLLDLFSGAGGAAMGYHRTGFDVLGVDIKPQPHYPFAFVQADALEYLAKHGAEFDVIHASPPCQAYSALKGLTTHTYQELVEPLRCALRKVGRPYAIENVVGAPLDYCLMLCGSMFGLETQCGAQLRRHRLFESSVMLMSPGKCQHGNRTIAVNGHEFRNEATRYAERKVRTITVTGSTPQQNVVYNTIRETFSVDAARIAMGIDWMGMKDLSQAIPPAYTEWIGRQLMEALAIRRKDGKTTESH